MLNEDSSPPRLVQAAGHGLLRLGVRHDTVVKPTTASEARFYQFVRDDPIFSAVKPFLPRHYSTNVVAEPNIAHPQHTHEIEIENLCLLDGREKERSSDEDHATDGDSATTESVKGTPMGSLTGAIPPLAASLGRSADADASPLGDASAPTTTHAAAAVTSSGVHPQDNRPGSNLPGPKFALADAKIIAATPSRTQWSAPSVLDLKVGRLRHGPRTSATKVSHIEEKDRGTTGPLLGLRICGLHHERRIVQTEHTSLVRNGSSEDMINFDVQDPALDDPISREDSKAHLYREEVQSEDQSDDDDATSHATLTNFDTLQTRRREPVRPAAAASPSSIGGVSGARSTGMQSSPMGTAAAARRKVRRHRRIVLGRRVEWVAGKALGRTVNRSGLVDALARFCTCVEVRVDPSIVQPGGRSSGVQTPLVPSQGSTAKISAAAEPPHQAGTFPPQPHGPLVRFYRDEARLMLAAIDESRLLGTYTLASSSLILVHDFHVKVSGQPIFTAHSTPSGCTITGRSFSVGSDQHHGGAFEGGSVLPNECIRFRAQLRLIDFSSSGRIEDGDVFPDVQVGFRDGLVAFIELLDDVLAKYCRTADC